MGQKNVLDVEDSHRFCWKWFCFLVVLALLFSFFLFGLLVCQKIKITKSAHTNSATNAMCIMLAARCCYYYWLCSTATTTADLSFMFGMFRFLYGKPCSAGVSFDEPIPSEWESLLLVQMFDALSLSLCMCTMFSELLHCYMLLHRSHNGCARLCVCVRMWLRVMVNLNASKCIVQIHARQLCSYEVVRHFHTVRLVCALLVSLVWNFEDMCRREVKMGEGIS